jgi:RpiB/LacA/LacB family sugar-phosphate isomerase
MRIAIGCDDIGFPVKAPLISALESDGHVVLDLGSFSTDPVDYPDYARAVGQAVLGGFADAGVLVCGSGAGAAIAANKLRTVRAAFCPDVATARQSRQQDHANVLCLAGTIDRGVLVEVTRAWVATPFLAAEPHRRRVRKIGEIENLMWGAEKEAPRGLDAHPEPAPAARLEGAPADSPPRSLPSPDQPGAAPRIGSADEDAAPDPGPDLGRAASHRPQSEPGREAGDRDALQLPLVDETLAVLESQGFLDRLWTKDTGLWKGDPARIADSLGWLTAPAVMRGHIEDLRTFADEIRRLHFSQIIVLGMGAAPLYADVFSRAFGSRMGFPDLLSLDSTDPAAVKHALDRLNLPRTLFVVSSKSGATAETMALYQVCRERVEATKVTRPGMQFVAITDPATPLGETAKAGGFRHTFLNHPSIGGRFAALSYFGLVPAALIGIDIKGLLDRARAMVERSGNNVGAHGSAAVRLGAALAAFAQRGRDKVTLVLSEKIEAFGGWIEQLLAESLGKDGKGVVPVVDEPLGDPLVYGPDRLFIALTLEGDGSRDAALDALAGAGHPVIRLRIADPLDLGAEFFRWQVAAATAGAILGVNPFDEPDAARTADYTGRVLAQWTRTRRFPDWSADAEENGIVLMAASAKPASITEGIMAHLAQTGRTDYLALQAYLEPSAETARTLGTLRALLRDRLRVATTLGFGPRYLYSTGQLHKGGPPTGLYIQLTGADSEDLAIPGAGHEFSVLKTAQALGDLEALRERGRRIIRLHLTGKPTQALQRVLQFVRAATRTL